jgi:hypothetical protein
MPFAQVQPAGFPNSDVPAVGAVAIDVSGGDQDLSPVIRGFHVGVAGNVAVILLDGSAVTFVGCVAGGTYPYACQTIVQTGTTATSIVGLR